MIKILKKSFFSFVIILIIITLSSLSVYAWDNCPFGLEDDPYPGECKRYVDSDNDGICDLSQPAPENRENLTYSNLNVAEDRENLTHPNLDITEEIVENQHQDEYSIEIEGKELKSMKVADIALLWDIEADDLLDEIVIKYTLIWMVWLLILINVLEI